MSEASSTTSAATAPATPAATATVSMDAAISAAFNKPAAPAPAAADAGKAAPAAQTPASAKDAATAPKKGILGALQPKPAAAKEGAPDAAAPAADADEAAATEGWSEPAKANWRKFREKHAAEIAAREAALAKAKQDHEALLGKYKDYDAVVQREKEYAQRLAILDFRNSPEFESQFVAPKQRAREAMTQALKIANSEADIGAIMALPEAERMRAADELIKDLPALARTRFERAFFEHLENERAEGEAVKNHETVRQQWQREQLAKRQKEREVDKALFAKTADEVFGVFQPAEVPEGATPEEAAQIEAYNKGLAQARKDAEEIAFGDMDANGLAQASINGAVGKFAVAHVIPGLVDTIGKLTAERDALKAQIDAIDKAKPGYSEGGSDGGGGKLMPSEQAIQRLWGNAA